jgi:meso-butanediol dehydrogenase/(S,S)-butanediol dehydrogenase/diacetyl reductase
LAQGAVSRSGFGFFGSRAALPYLLQSRGSIVNTASISGLFADYNFTAYAAAKGGVVNLTRAMAVDYAKDGVRVNAVCPGLVDTNLTHRFIENETTCKALSERIPMGRAAAPSEIAAAVAFLASSEATYITGVNLPIDGGLTAATGQPDFAGLGEILQMSGTTPAPPA